jgi:hypothetical protein
MKGFVIAPRTIEKFIFKVRVFKAAPPLSKIFFLMPAAGAIPPFSEPFLSKTYLSLSIQINDKPTFPFF